MANIVKIEWVERNKEFAYKLGQLQTLFGHSKSPFTVNGVSGAKLDSSKTSVPGPLKIGASTDTGSGTIGINDIEGVEVKVEIPLQEDFQLNLQSSFQSVEDMIPGGATEFIRLGKNFEGLIEWPKQMLRRSFYYLLFRNFLLENSKTFQEKVKNNWLKSSEQLDQIWKKH